MFELFFYVALECFGATIDFLFLNNVIRNSRIQTSNLSIKCFILVELCSLDGYYWNYVYTILTYIHTTQSNYNYGCLLLLLLSSFSNYIIICCCFTTKGSTPLHLQTPNESCRTFGNQDFNIIAFVLIPSHFIQTRRKKNVFKKVFIIQFFKITELKIKAKPCETLKIMQRLQP